MRKSWNIDDAKKFSEWMIHVKHHLHEIELAIDDIEEMQIGEEPLLSVDPRIWLIEEASEILDAAKNLWDLNHVSMGDVVDVPRIWRE